MEFSIVFLLCLVTTAAAQTTATNEVCGNSNYYGPSGNITSPNFPGYYLNDLNCDYNVYGSEGSSITFTFIWFYVEPDFDFVTISCPTNQGFTPEVFTGHSLPNPVSITVCSHGLVNFRTNSELVGAGFRIEYSVIEGCGADSYFDPFGVISSSNYPSNYDNMLDCDYNVYASAESSLTIIFNSFHVETFDFVTIHCPTNSGFFPRNYSGHTLPHPVSIPWCSQGLVNFRTDASVVSTGFSLDYYVSVGGCGQTLYTGDNGFVDSPNWESTYGYDQDCFNIIWVLEQSTIHLHFRYFDVENCSSCNCDWLEIRCLDNSENGPVKYCGNHDNQRLYIDRCSQLLLWFHSDENNNYPGFNIEYNIYLDAGCGAPSYYPPSGVISSPNYPGEYYANLDCNYDVQASPGSTISFIFKAFNTEECCDRVNISCPTNLSFTSLSFGGQSLPAPVSVPWCSQGRVNFRSDYSIFDTGFTLDYFVSFGGCGNTLYGGSHGYVTSPSYPSYYGDDQNCTNIIWAEQPSHFHLQFLYIDLPACGLCTCDWVEISCLDNNPSDTQRFCGEIERSHDVYQCTRVLVWFRSDSVNVYPGFNLEYNIYNESETTSVASTMDFTQTVTQSTDATTETDATTTSTSTTTPTSVASTMNSTQTVTQSTHAPPDCGTTSYYGPSGVISSLNYPGNYSNDLFCDYYVTASSASSSIAIIFEAFDTEECCDYVTISCPTSSSHPSIRYSGSTLPQPLSIPWCSKAAVNFITNNSTVSTGFSLDYHVSLGGCGDTVYTGSNGYVSSPNYPSNYNNNQNCSNIIWTRLRSSFSITFLYMNVEECCDFVELSCLDNAEYGSHRFTGTSIPPKLEIPTCTQVLVWFYSDDTVVQEGFSLEYFAA